jgi:hypothetical protein
MESIPFKILSYARRSCRGDAHNLSAQLESSIGLIIRREMQTEPRACTVGVYARISAPPQNQK